MKNKILILFKSHDSRFVDYHNDLYKKLEQIARQYCNLFENIDVIFIKANPQLESEYFYEKSEHIFWIKTEENYWQALKEKVIGSLKYFISDAYEIKYDYIFITNLSTFVNLKQLESLIEQIQPFSCAAYTGYYTPDVGKDRTQYEFPSGAGAIYSRESIRAILEYCKTIEHSEYPGADDIFLGKILKELQLGIRRISRPEINYSTPLEELKNDSSFSTASHVRIKFQNDRDLEFMYHKEMYIIVYGNNE